MTVQPFFANRNGLWEVNTEVETVLLLRFASEEPCEQDMVHLRAESYAREVVGCLKMEMGGMGPGSRVAVAVSSW